MFAQIAILDAFLITEGEIIVYITGRGVNTELFLVMTNRLGKWRKLADFCARNTNVKKVCQIQIFVPLQRG